MINIDKTTTSVVNVIQPNRGLVWDDLVSSWDDELQTWDEIGEIMNNVAKETTTITNINKP